MPIELSSRYNPKEYEYKWWEFWIKNKFFHSEVNPNIKPYTILMPPPNITNKLHMGHGTCYTLQDVLIRWKRMCGFNACWLPGTDHAGIATQIMLERVLWENEHKRKEEIGREAFTKLLWEWKEKYGNIIIEQFRQIGFSADWDRLCFTMDEKLSYAVRYVFVRLFEEGLIYRGKRLVNWDPFLKTALSDDEVVNKEIEGAFYYIKYPLVDNDTEFITIATTRPETMLGDTAVAVNPNDDRYKTHIGRNVKLPLTYRVIPVIADEHVDPNFGTGALKITPAHDFYDFQIGQRHNLEVIDIFNDDATLNHNVPESFIGLDRFEARKQVVKALKDAGLLDKQEPYKHFVPHSDRSNVPIEPKLSLQWFVKMRDLAKPAADAAREGKINFYPESWKKTYLYWLDNIQDWCISRQLWWGHRIPIWYCTDCGAYSTGMMDPSVCSKCNSLNIYQDEDVLDTWFSSWLWPISPFGWPSEDDVVKRELEYFYPSEVLVTAPEIIFLWVARMVMCGLKFKNEVPFKNIYFSSTVCDKQGRKFSKTLGNGIDPLEMIDMHGADAVRFTTLSIAPLAGRIRMDKSDFEMGARFINKLWNASRFILKYIDSDIKLKALKQVDLNMPSKWILNELKIITRDVNKYLETYRLNDAANSIYHFIWGSFCDWTIECSKPVLNDFEKRDDMLSVLIYVLEGVLRLLSPMAPFVCEEIWSKLPHHPDWKRKKSLVVCAYPTIDDIPGFEQEALLWDMVRSLISGIRSLRQQLKIPSKSVLDVYIKTDNNSITELINNAQSFIENLALVKLCVVGESVKRPINSLIHVRKGYESYICAQAYVDFEKEKARLHRELERLNKLLEKTNQKLLNPKFLANACDHVIQSTKSTAESLKVQIEAIRESLAAFN